MVINITAKERRYEGPNPPPCPMNLSGLHDWRPIGLVPWKGRGLTEGIAAWHCRCSRCRGTWSKPTDHGERLLITPNGHMTITRAHLTLEGVQALDVHPQATIVAIALPGGANAAIAVERLARWVAAGCPEPPEVQETR